MRVVLTALGTLGDVRPLLRVAAALEAQGDQALVLVNPFFEASARAMGLSVRAVGKAWDPAIIAADPRYHDPSHVWRDIFAPRIATDFAAVRAAFDEGPVAGVVNHFWCHGGALAAESLGLPWATVALAPLSWLSAAVPSQLTPSPIPPWLLGPIIRWVIRPQTLRLYEPAVASAARDLRLPARGDRFWGAQRRAALNVGLWSPLLRRPAADDPPGARVVGFPSNGGSAAALDPEVEAFLAAGPPPVVMGLGSVLPAIAQELYREVARACRALGQRALLVGASAEVAADLGPSVRAVAAAPYASLFPRASVVVHHGGAGSTADGMRAGRPTVVLPFGQDQHDNGWRVARLRAGVSLARHRATPARLSAAIRMCLSSARVAQAAAAVAGRLRAEEAGEVIAARAIREAFASARRRT